MKLLSLKVSSEKWTAKAFHTLSQFTRIKRSSLMIDGSSSGFKSNFIKTELGKLNFSVKSNVR